LSAPSFSLDSKTLTQINPKIQPPPPIRWKTLRSDLQSETQTRRSSSI